MVSKVQQAEWEAICGKSFTEIQALMESKVQKSLPDNDDYWTHFVSWQSAPEFFSDGRVEMLAECRECTRGCGKTRYIYKVEYNAKDDSNFACECVREL
mmetsp:Transcript_107405/g.299229  ORF Transcript_107405/g.299229 Transcript_107405/m.299229 type:complete len:99 (+) Transcript_107405:90-386(+)